MLDAAREALCSAGVLRENDAMPPFTVRMSGNLVFLVIILLTFIATIVDRACHQA